ncbi:hypothetical protein BJ322DRAFT_401547 [Thelephora terrestris]|uniref:F-box domain-containing protein n=1 Tax=Thelephora terrestris TaxID=56493 RepID=A0A9P6HMB6_9AGAM|nr:hypothetical protein BJ322DRAFT_401547 [Thelephora terrestris]
MAARVFCVDELATLIATHLVAISPRSAAALAQTCRALEVPALSALWETQDSIRSLITHVLSEDAWRLTTQHRVEAIMLTRPLNMWELDRLKRYASWIRRLVVSVWGFPEDITSLFAPTSSNAPPFLRFTLRELNWWLNRFNFSFITTFLSSHLTRIDIRTDPFGSLSRSVNRSTGTVPTEVVSVMRSAIKMFPSSLQFLTIYLGIGEESTLTKEIGLTEEISAFILGCGESLREFHSNLVLSTEAVTHLTNLPNLREWTTKQKPPKVTALAHNGIPGGPASVFPSLKSLQLRGHESLGWLSLFDARENRSTPWTVVGNNLSHLVHDHSTLAIDSTLLSRVLPLANLVEITLRMRCMTPSGPGCASRFSDQDLEHLAIALPKLEVLRLGEAPCGANTCPTTILSLFLLSIHCANLRILSVHFGTANIAADVMAMVDYVRSHDLHRRPKCALDVLVAGNQVVPLDDCEFALVSMAISAIFPSLARIIGSLDWSPLERLALMCGKAQEPTDLMSFLNELNLSERHETSSSLLERVERFLHKKVAPVTQEMDTS